MQQPQHTAAPRPRAAAERSALKRTTLPVDAVARWRALLAETDGTSRPLTQLPLDAADVLAVIAASPVAVDLEAALGPSPWCNLSQSWLRHGRPAHSWHQDGALRFDFLALAGAPIPRHAALQMRTLWIALTPCGRNAPSLQWVVDGPTALLAPAALTDAAVSARFGTAALAHAELQATEALLFDGLLLHRTYLTPAMQQRRSSLELRFFRADALPVRVAGDCGLRLPSSAVA